MEVTSSQLPIFVKAFRRLNLKRRHTRASVFGHIRDVSHLIFKGGLPTMPSSTVMFL